MKLLCLIALVVCASVQGAQLKQDTVKESTNNIQNIHLELHHASENTELSDDDRVLIEELQAFEKIHGRNPVGDAIQNALEGLRDVIVNGNEDFPPLDPLVIDEAGPVTVTASGVRISAMINDFSMTGIRWFVLDRLVFNPITLSFSTQITVPWVIVNGGYSAQAMVGFLQHTAGGQLNIFIHRIEVGLDMRLGVRIIGAQLFLRQLDIKIDIHDTQISISGLTGSTILNGLINAVLQTTTQEVIQSQMANVSALLSTELFDIINDILADFTINDILGK